MTVLLTISSICGAIVTILGLLTLLCKWPAKWIRKESRENVEKIVGEQLKEIKEELAGLTKTEGTDEEATKAMLRHEITEIYETYGKEKVLPLTTKQDLCSLYEVYCSLHGNSYVHQIYEEMLTWNVK